MAGELLQKARAVLPTRERAAVGVDPPPTALVSRLLRLVECSLFARNHIGMYRSLQTSSF